MAAPKDLAEPHKELRFTRAGQAQGFIVAAAVAFAFALLIAVTWVMGHPSFHWWMPLIPLVMAALMTRLAIRCARHAYIILTPMGVEIFPLFKPEKNLNLVYWTQLEGAEFDEELTTLKLHYNEEKTAGVILSLKPVLPKKRPLLKKALEGRLAEKS
jgi:hypothetical protein